MGVLASTSNISENTLKIPDYAKDYKKEYLFIRGIDKYFEYLLDNIKKAYKGVFQNNRVDIINKNINRLEKAIKMGYLKDISNLEIDEQDVSYSSLLLEQLGDFSDNYVDDDDDWEFDLVGFDMFVDLEFPGYKNLVKCIELFHSKFKVVFDKYKINWNDSDSDEYDSVSDSDSDSNDEPGNDSDSDY